MEIIELKNIIADIDNFYGKPLSLLFKPFINEYKLNLFSKKYKLYSIYPFYRTFMRINLIIR